MKIETFEKAKSLKERIDKLDTTILKTSHCGETKPNEVYWREFEVCLTDEDANTLHTYIDRWLKNRKKNLQKEFDNLK